MRYVCGQVYSKYDSTNNISTTAIREYKSFFFSFQAFYNELTTIISNHFECVTCTHVNNLYAHMDGKVHETCTFRTCRKEKLKIYMFTFGCLAHF